IDFGMIVDGAVVMMENHVRWREQAGGNGFTVESAERAAKEVARPMVFGVAIIIAVYLPILFLEGLEGRMFRPMAITVCMALFGSLLLALTVIPALASLIFRHGLPASVSKGLLHRVTESMKSRYGRMLEWAIDHRWLTVGVAAVILGIAVASLLHIGTEFMPRLDEGSILI